jgi:rhodanese-related sulfurtransferase
MEPERIAAEEAKRRMDSGEAAVFLDARDEDEWRRAELQIPKSLRVPPDAVEAHLDEIPSRGLIVPYCSRAQEQSSARVAQALLQHGRSNVRPLAGGFEAWRAAGYATEAKPERTQTFTEVEENVWKAEGDEDVVD